MKKLIVTADDFGLSPGINKGIIQGFRKGIIKEASIMANLPYFKEAANLAKANPGLGVGIHLNLTWGKPLSLAKNIPGLVDKKGYFKLSIRKFFLKSFFQHLGIKPVETELRQQVEKVLKFGIKLSHLDSHQHFHAFPKMQQVIFKIAQDYGISIIRCPLKNSLLGQRKKLKEKVKISKIGSFIFRNILKDFKNEIRKQGFKSTDYFHCMKDAELVDFNLLRGQVKNLKHGTHELCCHPGNIDAVLQQTPSKVIYTRQRELEILLDPKLDKILKEANITLCSFKDI